MFLSLLLPSYPLVCFFFFFLQFIECCKKGANLLIQGPDHCSLLHHAAKTGHGEIVKYILEHGESQRANPQSAVLSAERRSGKTTPCSWKCPGSLVITPAKCPPAAWLSRKLGI